MLRNLVVAALALLTAACAPIPAEMPAASELRRPVDGSAAISEQDEVKDIAHDLVAHIDIRGVATALDGETLTVTFQLRDLPETLTFNRTGVPKHALEYNWEVSIDVDNDPATGSAGFDYMLSAGYFVHPLAKDSDTVAEITQPGFVKAGLWGLNRRGYRVPAEADIAIAVSAEENTITLSGDIPGITEASRLKLRAYDFFAGSVEMSGHGPSITGLAASQCMPDRPIITPGQTVLDAADVPAAHVDVVEINSSLSEEFLTVVFRLRDVPETLTFDRTGGAGECPGVQLGCVDRRGQRPHNRLLRVRLCSVRHAFRIPQGRRHQYNRTYRDTWGSANPHLGAG